MNEDLRVMRNVHTEEGGARVERGWHFPACSGSCDQGRKQCPHRDACQLPDAEAEDFTRKRNALIAAIEYAGPAICLWGAVLAFLAVNGWL